MKAHKIRFVLLLLGLFAITGAHFSVQAQSADQVFKRLRAKYDGVQSVKAEFTQTLTSSYSKESSSSSGTVYLQGNKYRVEAAGQTLVTDGKVTWVYLPSDKQVLINDYQKDETTFSLNDFLFAHRDRYNVVKSTTTRLDGQKHHVLTLKPKQKDAFYTEVVLSMRDKDNVVTRLQVQDLNGTKMFFTLKNIQLNPKLNSTVFTFQPPKNVEIVDLRS